jgi:hypothetical protein
MRCASRTPVVNNLVVIFVFFPQFYIPIFFSPALFANGHAGQPAKNGATVAPFSARGNCSAASRNGATADTHPQRARAALP